MKLALASAATQRQDRRERLRRDRATARALREVFPAVQQLHLEFVFQGHGATTPAMQSHTLHGAARAFFEFSCPYADCDGQFDLTGAVKAALAHPSQHARGELECSGKRPVRVGTHESCRLRLSYTVAAITS
jgi:hypothetical protein